MKLSRLDVAPTLTVAPDTDNATYYFYDWQVVKFTATLRVPGGVADGATIVFHSIGEEFPSDGQKADFVLFCAVGAEVDTTYDSAVGAYEVVARSTGEDRSVAVAEIVAKYVPLVEGSPWSGEFYASASIAAATAFRQAYSGAESSPGLPTEQNTFQLLPPSTPGEVPSNSEGNFFRWEAYVASKTPDDSPGKPLKNICIRLYSDADYSFSGARFFTTFEARDKEALPVKTLPQQSGFPGNFYVDIVTDEHGVATLFVCAANTSGTHAGRLLAKSGTLEKPCFNYVLPDFISGGDSRLQGPSVVSPLTVTSGADVRLQCTVPSYDSAARNDYLFLLCNKRMQQVNGSFVQRTDTNAQTMYFSKFGLHNQADGDGLNQLAYVVLPANEPAKLSSTREFYVKGDPGSVTFDASGVAPAPYISEGMSVNGVVMNVNSTLNGIAVAVPVGEDNNPAILGWGEKRFQLNVAVGLVGWMDDAEVLQVGGLQSSFDREITPAEIDRGVAHVWFPRISLWGVGQSPEGSTGRCLIQYTVTPVNAKPIKSEVFVSHIDTLPPQGAGEYFEIN